VIREAAVELSVVAMFASSASRWAVPACAGRRRLDRRRFAVGWSVPAARARVLAGRLSPKASPTRLDIRHTPMITSAPPDSW